MTDEQVLKLLLLTVRSKIAYIRKDWGPDLPPIPQSEIANLKECEAWLYDKAMELHINIKG